MGGVILPKRFSVPSWVGPAFVYGLSVACLIWVYRDFQWREQLPRLLNLHWAWLLAAVITDVAVYVVQAWRWNLLLRPLASVPLGRSVRAIYIGLFANELLPFRSGEAIRCYLQSRWSKLPFTETLSSAIIERLIDGIWLILGLTVTAWFMPIPRTVEVGIYVLAGLVSALSALVIFAVADRRYAHHVVSRHRWAEHLRYLAEGLHIMARSRSFPGAVAVSILYLAMQVAPIYAVARGYGIQITAWEAAVVLVMLRLGTVVPGPPSNVGVFNAFAVIGLTLAGVDRQTATGLSGLMFFVITIPLLAGGVIALLATGIRIRDLHLHVRKAAHRSPVQPPVRAD